jgi:hypothetical protein
LKVKVQIAPKANPVDEKIPFGGDLFHRLELAEKLTLWLDRLPSGGVLAIDAAWGSGKSWFGLNWHNQLKKEGYRVSWIDAFASDYIDDPFLLVAAELSSIASSGKASEPAKFKSRIAGVARALAPALGKAAVQGAVRAAFGDEIRGHVEESLREGLDGAADGIEAAIKARLSELQQRKRTIQAFRESLSAIAQSTDGKPIVVFVDELDRCRPDFAIGFLERLKHFFNVPGVIFVLLVNMSQLQEAIKGMYGAGVDANLYLQKFIMLSVALPQGDTPHRLDRQYASRFVFEYGKRSGLDSIQGFDEFAGSLADVASFLSMSYRDIERVLARYAVVRRDAMSQRQLAWFISIAVAYPEWYQRLLKGSGDDHRYFSQAIAAVNPDVANPETELGKSFIGGAYQMHAFLSGAAPPMTEQQFGSIWRFANSIDPALIGNLITRSLRSLDRIV